MCPLHILYLGFFFFVEIDESSLNTKEMGYRYFASLLFVLVIFHYVGDFNDYVVGFCSSSVYGFWIPCSLFLLHDCIYIFNDPSFFLLSLFMALLFKWN